MIWLYLVLLVLHILCCVAAFLLIQSRILRVHRYMFFVVLFLPFWGALTVLVLHFQFGIKEDGMKQIGVEKMQLDNEIFRSVTVENKHIADMVVPLEEALIINSPTERRELIMDILNDNPKEYIEFLQKAGNNEDTEVVHYAVTAMVEISKENDYKLQQYERMYGMEPDNFEVLAEYSDFLWRCLEQNLMQGRAETVNRLLFNELMQKKIAVKAECEDYLRVAKNNLKMQNYTATGEAIAKLNEKWQDEEEVVLLKLQYYAALGKADAIKTMLKDMDSRKTFLSAKVREAIAFWGD